MNAVLSFIYQNALSLCAMVIAGIALYVCCKKKMPPAAGERPDLPTKIIIYSTIISILCIGAVVVYELFAKQANAEISGVGEILSMQSITLTITGISISLIAIISSVLTSSREQKYEKIENELKEQLKEMQQNFKEAYDDIQNERDIIDREKRELQQKQEVWAKNSELLNGLLLTDGIFLEKKKESLFFDLADSSDDNFVKYFYVQALYQNSLKNAPEQDKLQWNKAIIKQGEALLYDMKDAPAADKVSKTQKYLLYIMVGNAYLDLAKNDIMNATRVKDEDINNNFRRAETYLEEALSMDGGIDSDGYVHNCLGLVSYWEYKYHQTKNEGSEYLPLLNQSISRYTKAIEKNARYPKFYNNKGVSLLQKYKLTGQNRDEILNEANACFLEAVRLDPDASNAAINLADIAITKVRNLLGLQQDILRFDLVSIDGVDKDTLLDVIADGEMYLNNAASINPFLVNNYYKRAQLHVYQLFYLQKLGSDTTALKESIQRDFAMCGKINPTSQAVYYIKRMYYCVLGDIDKAREINAEIRFWGSSNADRWAKLHDNL